MHTASRIATAYSVSLPAGRNLQELDNGFIKHFEYLNRLNQANTVLLVDGCRQLILNLRDPNEAVDDLGGSLLCLKETLAFYEERSDKYGLFSTHFQRLYLAMLFRNAETSVTSAMDAEVYGANMAGSSPYPVFMMLQALALMGGIAKKDRKVRAEARRIVKRNRRKLAFWAKHAPENTLHRSLLVEAEYLRVRKGGKGAREKYESAISRAYEKGFVNDAALACELFAEFHHGQMNTIAARIYLRQARSFFQHV